VRNGRLVVLLVASVAVVAGLWGYLLVAGVSPRLGLDLQGGVSLTLVPAPGQDIDLEVLDETVAVIRQRVDGLGVAEPEVARQGETVLVQLPGITDQETAEEVVGRTAQLQFRPVLEVLPPGAPGYDDAPACDEPRTAPPAGGEEVVVCEKPETLESTAESATAVPAGERLKFRLGPAAVSGDDVADAQAALDAFGNAYEVQLGLADQGEAAFAEITGQLACEPPGSPQRQLAIVLDGVVEYAPPMAPDIPCGQGIPGGQAIIQTGGGEDEADQLALVLRTGALPIELEFAQSQSVSPTLGRDSLQAGLVAGLIGLALVAAYLVFLYRGIGLAACLELVMFGLVTVGAVFLLSELAGFTLTLAGIAGLIVSIGLAADSSIIYRERYRDELRGGRTVRSAADKAYANAWQTTVTGNTVSLLAAVVLYALAVGPVRGFAFTLGLSTLIDALLFCTFTRGLFGLLARSPRAAKSRLMGLRADVAAPGAPPTGVPS